MNVKGMAHITGGGFIENIPRMLPGCWCGNQLGIWTIPPIFKFLKKKVSLNEKKCLIFSTWELEWLHCEKEEGMK